MSTVFDVSPGAKVNVLDFAMKSELPAVPCAVE